MNYRCRKTDQKKIMKLMLIFWDVQTEMELKFNYSLLKILEKQIDL